eukprot:329530-Alexandrium_andersonii.AAC.1
MAALCGGQRPHHVDQLKGNQAQDRLHPTAGRMEGSAGHHHRPHMHGPRNAATRPHPSSSATRAPRQDAGAVCKAEAQVL